MQLKADSCSLVLFQIECVQKNIADCDTTGVEISPHEFTKVDECFIFFRKIQPKYEEFISLSFEHHFVLAPPFLCWTLFYSSWPNFVSILSSIDVILVSCMLALRMRIVILRIN